MTSTTTTQTPSSPPRDDIEIIWIPLSTVSPYEANPKNPNSQIYEQLMHSIKQFGLVLPLHVIPHDGEYVLIDGHQRFHIIDALGWERAPFVVHRHISYDEIPAFIETISNTTAAWDKKQLADILARLQNRMDIRITGFTTEESDKLIQQATRKAAHVSLKPKPIDRKRRISVMLTSKEYELVSNVLAEIMAEGYGEPEAMVRMVKAAADERGSER